MSGVGISVGIGVAVRVGVAVSSAAAISAVGRVLLGSRGLPPNHVINALQAPNSNSKVSNAAGIMTRQLLSTLSINGRRGGVLSSVSGVVSDSEVLSGSCTSSGL
jgi:hypothetical protein